MTTEANFNNSAHTAEEAAEAMPEEGKWGLAAIYGLSLSFHFVQFVVS